MRQSMQRLVPADELLCHQTPETFATISQADVSWSSGKPRSAYPIAGWNRRGHSASPYFSHIVSQAFRLPGVATALAPQRFSA